MPAYIFRKAIGQLKLHEPQFIQMHRDIVKLRSLGVDEDFLRTGNLTPGIARDLLRDLLYLRDRYPRQE